MGKSDGKTAEEKALEKKYELLRQKKVFWFVYVPYICADDITFSRRCGRFKLCSLVGARLCAVLDPITKRAISPYLNISIRVFIMFKTPCDTVSKLKV